MKRQTNKLSYGVVGIWMFFCCGLQTTLAEDWIYKVREGDNLWNLTADHLIDMSYVGRVQKLNNIADPWHILPGTRIRIPSQWVRHYPALVRVQNLQGSASIIEDGADHAKPLKPGSVVMLGDTVITHADSTLVLGFLDGSRILLQENSRLKIDHLMLLEYTGMSDSRLQLEAGRLETQVVRHKGTARRFEIKTPATVTSVRGTDYRLSAEAQTKESRTEVVEGKVAVKGGAKTRQLISGFGTVIALGKAPIPPVKLLPPPDTSQLPTVFGQVPIQFAMPDPKEGQGYRVQIAKTDLFRDVMFDKTFTGTIIRGPDLPDGNYHIRIRGIDAQQLEGQNAQQQFSINARPEAPFPVSPKPGEGILIEDNPEFSWSRQQGDPQYHLQVAADEAFSKILVDQAGISEEALTVTDELPLGKYYWRVAAVDQDGDGPFSDSQMFRRILPAPEIDEPEISEDTLMIRSRSGLPGQTYHFQMSDDADFSELMVDQQTDQPGFEIPRPAAGEYFIRVRTIDPDGFIGPFGAPQSINVPYDDLYWLLVLLPLFALFAL